jgi:hypothetical protein
MAEEWMQHDSDDESGPKSVYGNKIKLIVFSLSVSAYFVFQQLRTIVVAVVVAAVP